MSRYAIVFIIIVAVFKGSIGLIAPIYPLYLKQFGLDDLGIPCVNICFYLGFFCLDVPAGIFADRFGHRKSVVLGLFLRIIGFYIFMKATSWWHLPLGEIFIGSGAAFCGSALQAWFVNGMRSEGKDHLIPRFYAAEAGLSSCLLVVAGIFSSVFMSHGYRFMYLSIVVIATTLLVLSAIAINPVSKKEIIEPVKFKLKEISKYVDGDFKKICIIYFIFFLSTQGINLQWQSWARQNGVTDSTVASIFSGMQSIAIVSVWFSGWWISSALDKVKASWHLLVVGLLSLSCFVILPAVLPFNLGIWAIALQSISRGGSPICADIITKGSIKYDEYRTALTSVTSAFRNAGAICGLVLGGVLARYCSAHCGWIVSGSILLIGVVAITLTFVFKKEKEENL